MRQATQLISCCCVAITLYCDIYKLTFVVVAISSCCNQFFGLFTEVRQPLFRRQVRYVTAFSFPALNAPFSSPALNTPPQENFKWSNYYILSCRIPIKHNQFYISLASGTLQCCLSPDSTPQTIWWPSTAKPHLNTLPLIAHYSLIPPCTQDLIHAFKSCKVCTSIR